MNAEDVVENWSDFESEESDVCSEGGEESEDSVEDSVEDSEESSADEDDLPDSWREVPGQWIYLSIVKRGFTNASVEYT